MGETEVLLWFTGWKSISNGWNYWSYQISAVPDEGTLMFLYNVLGIRQAYLHILWIQNFSVL